ncbi:hypothetical protein KZ774_13760 [Escherichia coli]|nr:hypothetical protein [Escherichia coli]
MQIRGRDIIINQSEDNLFQYVSYVHDLPGGIRVSLSIDILYFITSSWKSVLFWILTALIFAEYGADALPLIPKCVARKY